MTLHDAIQQLLIDSKSELTSSQLAKLINDNKLYVRRDKKSVTASQVMSRIGNYPKLFKKNGNKISLKGFNELDLIEEEIKNDLRKFINHLYHNYSFKKSSVLPFVLRSLIEVDENPDGIGNANIFFENVSRDVEFGRSFDFMRFDILPHFLDVIFKIQRHPNRNRILQKIIYWLNDSSRGSDLMLLPEYVCSIIGGYNFYGEQTMLYTTANMLNNFKLSIFENNPDKVFDHAFSDLWANEDVLKINTLLLRAAHIRTFRNSNDIITRLGVITPPWGVRDRNHRWSSNFQTIMDALEHYDKPLLDKALLVVPEGALFGGGKDLEARRILTQEQHIESVVTIPFNSNYTGIKSAVLITFDFTKRIEDVFFADFNLLEKFDIENDWKRVNSLINSKEVLNDISTIVSTNAIFDKECSWLPQKHILKPLIFEKKRDHQTISIKDVLVNWYKGKNVERKKLYEGGELKYIRTSDLIDENVYINITDKTLGVDYDEVDHNVFPVENSLAVSLIGNKLKTGIIPSNAPFIFQSHLAVIEVETNKVLPEFLAYELKEPYVQQQLEYYRKGTTIPRVSLSDFLELLVQIPSLEQQKDILLSKDRAVKDNDKNELAFDYIATLKHTLKQQLKTLSSDLVSVTKFLSDLEKSKKSIQLDDIIVSVFPGEDVSKLSDYKLSKTLERMSRSLDNAHSSLDQAQNALEIESIKKTRFDIKELIEEIKSSHPNLEIKISGKKQEILADRGQIRMALNNIVNNAVKHGFNEENKPWEIGFRVDPQKTNDPLLIEITNNGRPFPSDFNSEEFLSKGGKTGNNQGTGFGGYLINKIIENHKGQIEIVPTKDIEFEKYNVKFIISLPKL